MKPRLVLFGLLVVGAALFAIGVAAERSGEPRTGAATESSAHTAAGEHAETSEERHGDATASSHETEKIFGVRAESGGTVAGVILASAILSLAVWRRIAPVPTVIAALVFAGSAAALDAAETVRKLDEHRPGVAAIAAGVAVIHVATVALSGAILRSEIRRGVIQPAIH
ncbi:MAG: hypothetical protein LC792_04650 [Actinobacteria bacterium]|nr:hypothetical protein [Actinomycetota bacterium]